MPGVWLSLGSNIDPEQHIRSAIKSLREVFGSLQISPVYESQAVGFDGDNFLNLVVGISPDDDVKTLGEKLRDIETEHGRTREGQKFSSRTLDIDLLTYGNEALLDQGLNIPRDEITKYAFVLKPLADIAADELHPVLNIAYGQLWSAFDATEQPMQKIEMSFD